MKRVGILLMVVALLGGVRSARAADGVSQLEVLPEEVVGIALYSDGVTPVIDLPVRVWSIKKNRMVSRTRTDDSGIFRVPEFDPGDCYMFVGRVKISMKVLQKDTAAAWQRHDVVVVLPDRFLVAGPPRLTDVLVAPVLMQLPLREEVVSP